MSCHLPKTFVDNQLDDVTRERDLTRSGSEYSLRVSHVTTQNDHMTKQSDHVTPGKISISTCQTQPKHKSELELMFEKLRGRNRREICMNFSPKSSVKKKRMIREKN